MTNKAALPMGVMVAAQQGPVLAERTDASKVDMAESMRVLEKK